MQCRCTHYDHEHKLMQQVLWPSDNEPPLRFRGACYKCNCCLFVDSRQMAIDEDVYGSIHIG
jgi:hypothetical protein